MGMPRYRRIPFSPSMNVMALLHEPVFEYPSSRVIQPDSWRSFEMSTAFSFYVPTTMGS